MNNVHASLGNILIVDDDKAITDLLQFNFKSEGYSVTVRTRTADVGDADIRAAHVLLIDAGTQSPAGCEIIGRLRSTAGGRRMGIIYYSDLPTERSLIDALDAGADDVMRKPFSLREMMARVRAVLRRRCREAAAPDEANVICFNRMKVDITARRAYVDDEALNLSNTEFAILELLMRNVNTYTPRIEIFRRVWPDGLGANERIVDTNISRLRRKLGSVGACIVNRSGHGYMLSE